MSDRQIHSAVVERLECCADLHPEHVGVGVTAGAVTLAGEVANAAEKAAAIRAATTVEGVLAVIDDIAVHGAVRDIAEVVPPDIAADAVIARQVQALLTAQHPSLTKGVVAQVRSGKVIVTGELRSYPVQQYLVYALRSTLGADAVIDRTTVPG